MNIVILVGSYRKHGNTARISAFIVEELRKLLAAAGESLQDEVVFLNHEDLQLCRGCRVCFDHGEEKCPLHDGLLALRARMHAADLVLVATPVYVDDVSGSTKNWMDRLAFACHRPEFYDQKAYLLYTTGSALSPHTLRTLNTIRTWGYTIIGQMGFKTGALMNANDLARHQKNAQKAARRIFQRTRRKENPSWMALMIFSVQQALWQKEQKPSYDLIHWKGKGWLEPGVDYYSPHTSHFLKRQTARWLGRIIARLVV